MRLMLACIAAAAVAAVLSVAARGVNAKSVTGENAYSVTIDGNCTTDYPAVYNGINGVAIQIGSDTFHIAINPLNKFIEEAGYFWWLSDVHQPLPPPPEVPADTPLINKYSIKVYVAHGACGSAATTTTTTTTTTTAFQPKAYYCPSKYSKKPLLATENVVAQNLAEAPALAPYWVIGRHVGWVNAGRGHLVCAIPKGMVKDGVFRDSQGKALAHSSGLNRQPGAYPEVKKR